MKVNTVAAGFLGVAMVCLCLAIDAATVDGISLPGVLMSGAAASIVAAFCFWEI